MADIHKLIVRGPLQNVSVGYRNQNYIADRLFPYLPVGSKSEILTFGKGAWFRDEAGIRARGTRAPRGTYSADTIDVNPKQYAFASEVTTEDREEAAEIGAPPLSPDIEAVEYATEKILLKNEVRAATSLFTATWCGSAGLDVAGGWARDAADPGAVIDDIEDGIEEIRSRTGRRPNRLMITANVLAHLKQNSAILDRIKYTERGVVSAELLAAMFDLDQVVVGDAIKSTAVEKKDGTDWLGVNIWEKNAGKGSAFLYYAPETPGRKVPSAGYLARNPYKGVGDRRVRKWFEDAEDQDVYEVAERNEVVLCGPDCGYLFIDVIAD